MRTRDETIAQALKLLGITPIGEDADADYAARVGEHFDACILALDSEHDLGLPIDADSVPDDIFMPLARFVAGASATEFDRTEYVGFYEAGLRSLTAISALETRTDGRPIRTEYF